ncbi:MAG: hypothetical protein EAZ97_04040 [Bacteroidetes bacterium]|nr:MAG: hypothetical protein EAZ97_04040 [Bacteroidota bacterium]
METTNKMFDMWVDSQNKLVENWVETTKKFQVAAGKGELVQKGLDFYKEWYENQKGIVGEVINKSSENLTENSPETIKNWLGQQKEFSTKWIDMMNAAFTQPASAPENFLGESKKLYDNWLTIFNQNFGKFGESFKDMQNFMTGSTTKDAFSNMFTQSKNYLEMLEFWKPFYKMVTENKFNPEEYMKTLGLDKFGVGTEKFQEMSKMFFGFMLPDKNHDFFGQISSYLNSYRDIFRTIDSPFKQMYEQYDKIMPSFSQNDFFGASMKIQHQTSEQWKKMYEPFAKIMPQSPSKDLMESMVKMQENLNHYQVKYSEMQYVIANTMQKALEKTAKALFEQAKESKTPQTYQEFFSQWTSTLESGMIELFNGEHFGKVQAELLEVGLDIKMSLEKNIELALAPLPVAPRSEVDGLHKQIHELKSKLKSLEKKVSGSEAIIVEEEPKKTVNKKK